MLLAENGARAIKVEPRGGSRERGTPHFHVLNRSKRALELDLDDRASQARVADLIRWADIVVTGFTPARLRQLNLDPESIRRINPARDCARRASAREPRPRRRLRRERRPGRCARRYHRQPVGAQRQSRRAGFSGGELFGGRDGGDRGRCRDPRARSRMEQGRPSRSRFWPAPSRSIPAESCVTKK